MALNTLDVEVGNRMRMRRILLGLSQEEIGARLGITFQQIQKYEKGVNRISAGRLFEIAQILNVSIRYFYDQGSSHEKRDLPETELRLLVTKFVCQNDGRDLIAAFMRINDHEIRSRIVDLVISLSKDHK